MTFSPVFDDSTNKKNQEIYDRAIKSLDELQCKDITNDMTRSMCWDTIIPLRAKRDKDETICDSLKDPMTKNACSTSIILEKAQTQ
jgi:hypothetical protein